MICLRCGYCCKNMVVGIVDNPELGLTKENIIAHRGDGTPCKHLRGDKIGEYSCAVHDKDWYEQTPCFGHTQVESSPDVDCRTGRYLLEQSK